MKLWLLLPKEIDDKDSDPWRPWYDKVHGFVIRAESEQQARRIADENGGEETGTTYPYECHPWLDSRLSSCEEVTPQGQAEIILTHYFRS